MAAVNKYNLNRLKGGSNIPTKAPKKGNKDLYLEDDRQENMKLLQKAENYWDSQEDWRQRVDRAWRYATGDQWGDLVYDPERRSYVKEGDLIKEQGQVPFVVNMIAPLIQNIIGQFLSSKSRSMVIAQSRDKAETSDMLTNTLWAIHDKNNMWLKDANALNVYLCSSAIVQRTTWGKQPGRKKKDATFKNVELSSFIMNPIVNEDYSDLTMIGEFHDIPINNVISMFAQSKGDEERIRGMYNFVPTDNYDITSHFSDESTRNKTFMFPVDSTLCRVFEIWYKVGVWEYEYHDVYNGIHDYEPLTPEVKRRFDQVNAERIMAASAYGIKPEEIALITYEEVYSEKWNYKFMTPHYETLKKGVTPYDHGLYPYRFMFHPLIRGEVHSFIESLIDIQRGFNRDRILLDFVIGSSAKGTLLIDENSISDDFPFEDIAETYTKRNGVIKLNLKAGATVPQHLTSKAIPAGLNESLQLGMSLMKQMGGISDALMGRDMGAGTPASLYAQSSQNSTLNIKHRLDAFNIFRTERDRALLDLKIQYEDDLWYLPVSGSKGGDEANIFDKSKLPDDFTYEMTVGMGSDSQVYRAMTDSAILDFVKNGLIPVKIGLRNTSLPNVDKLISDLDEFERQQSGAATQGGTGAMPPNISQGLIEGMQAQGADPNAANPQAMALMQQYAQ